MTVVIEFFIMDAFDFCLVKVAFVMAASALLAALFFSPWLCGLILLGHHTYHMLATCATKIY